VTLGTTFAATQVAGIEDRASLPSALRQQLPLLSTLFLAGILLLLSSFALGGWIRSRRLRIATTVASVFGVVAVFFALSPFLQLKPRASRSSRSPRPPRVCPPLA
jgi:hypothetical protein